MSHKAAQTAVLQCLQWPFNIKTTPKNAAGKHLKIFSHALFDLCYEYLHVVVTRIIWLQKRHVAAR